MTCKDCMYYFLCANSLTDNYIENMLEKSVEENCLYFKDKSKIIELPCKVGDTVYAVNDCLKEIVSGIVEEICHCGNNTRFHTEGYNIQEDVTEFGKTVFLTREEAEKALKEMGEK